MFTLLYWIFCFAFAFDFRGEKGGSVAQYLFLAAALGSGVLTILATPKALRSGPTRVLSMLWWFYLGTTVCVALFSGVQIAQYFRCVLPALLFGLALNLGQSMAVRNYSAEAMIKPLLWAGILSVFWRFIHAVIISKIPIDVVRYEMLSPAIPLLFAAAAASAVLSRKIQPLPLAGGALALISVLISVTRSYIFTLVAAFAAVAFAFLVILAAKYWSMADLRRRMVNVFAGGVLMLVAFAILYVVQPAVFERWAERLFNDGGGHTNQEVTLLTREAEATAMLHLLKADPVRFVYGKGMGAGYYWDSSYFPELMLVYDHPEDIEQDFWEPGHSVWTYSLFSGGFFALSCYVFLFGWLVFVGISAGRRAVMLRSDTPELAFLPFVIGVCYFSQTLTANPFGERFSAQILGLFAALPQVFLMRAAMKRRADTPPSTAPAQFTLSPHVTTAYRPG